MAISARRATAISCSNIAFIKYWGNRDPELRIPWNDSISMNLSNATTTTTVAFDDALAEDVVVIGDREVGGPTRQRVVVHLDRVRALAGITTRARVISRNSFPMGTGIASSASAFAALSLAATAAAGLTLTERELSCLARLGSGSACRSVPAGFAWWQAGTSHETSYAVQLAPPDHWDLRDLVAVVSTEHKAVTSAEGHSLAPTSPFFQERLAHLPTRLEMVRRTLMDRDFETFGQAVEAEAIELHLIALTSQPPLRYLTPATLQIMHAVQTWRAEGLPVYFTLDAGPNVHLICEAPHAEELCSRLSHMPVVQDVIVNAPGPGARLVATP
jgi:diphosphomevalonate decarboxylase